MADNIELDAGSGGAVLAADDISSVFYQIVKLAHGALDTATLVSTAGGLPVDIRQSNATVTVDGTITADLSVTDNAVLDDIAALTSSPVVYVDDADWADGSSKHLLVGGLYQGTPQSITDGDVGPLEVDSTGRLRVVVEANVSHAVTNAGTFAVQVDGNALTALQLIDDPVAVLGTATYTETTTKGAIVGAVRNNDLAALADTDNEIAPLQVCEDGGLWTRPAAGPKGGCKMFTSVDLDESEEDPAAGPVTIYGIYAWNTTAAPKWLQMFNTNTVTVGTTAPDNNFMIPANADSDGAGVVLPIPVSGLAYSTALTVAATGAAGTDNTDPGASACGVVIFYQD